ncbi:transcriptional regulator [Tahibacter aquaticus]|uniref:Transcriptional regulator n=1 Tax=Tahibacter aquaticus TaxID=520092 RepID=A0A4R6Z733_9GAMM|nr:YafY family protein [Tahibacter aquaticus]TDR47591.1 transcriptional regulator [Tahibacter aquaticus]
MSHPASRVLTVLELLQAHGRLSGTDLAQRLDVDVRTLRRYIRVLEDIGIPIMAERGRYGAYSLVPGFKLPPLVFGDDEALALSLGLLAARRLGLADAAPAVASALAKLERVMPAALQKRIRAVAETVTLDLSHTPAATDSAALLELSAAAQSQRRVRLDYRAADGAGSRRDFDAYGLAFRSGRWYAVGHCHLRRELRSFRLDRIVTVIPLDQSFGRPANFDAAAQLELAMATLPRAIAVEVLLHTDLARVQAESLGSIGVFEARDDGVLLRTRTDSLEWFARQLARLPFDFEILLPDELRDALATQAQRLVRAARQNA